MEEDLKFQKDMRIKVAAILTAGMLSPNTTPAEAVAKFEEVYKELKKFQY